MCRNPKQHILVRHFSTTVTERRRIPHHVKPAPGTFVKTKLLYSKKLAAQTAAARLNLSRAA
jgi:hypothetical protein